MAELQEERQITAQCASCLRLSEEFCDLLESYLDGGIQYDVPQIRARQELARLRYWERQHAVGSIQRPSPHRAPNNPAVKSFRAPIISLLEDLSEALGICCEIASGKEANSRISMPHEPDDDGSEDSSSEEGVSTGHGQLSKLQEAFGWSIDVIDRLFSWSAIIEDDSRQAQFAAMLTDQKTIPVDIDVLDQIKQYFPRLSHDQSLAWLVDRLGSALSQQRRYLRHLRDTSNAFPMRDMFAELSTACGTRKSNVLAQAKETELSSTNLKLTPGIEGSKKTYKIAPLEEVSHTERAGGMNLGQMTAFDRPFQCPYCWTTQVVSNESTWRQHVWSDVVPYICTFEDCDTEVFGDSQAWYEHQIHKHFMEWRCPFCPNHFQTLEDFHSHLKGYSLEYSKTQLNALSSACRHPKQQIASSACLLCKDTDEMFSLDHFKDHVCGHLEHVSLFIVPSFMQEAPEASVLPSRLKSTLKMSNPGFRADVADALSEAFGAVDEDVKSLLADDVDLGPVGFRLKTIRKAVRNPECKLTKLLFTHDEDSKTESGIPSSTDLDHVAKSIKVIIREFIKDDGFDPNSQDDAKRTALSQAAERGDLAAILVLLNLPHLKEEPLDTRGRVSLHYATEKGHYAAVKLIMKKWPTSLNAQDNSGASPLILAVANRHEATATLLLQNQDFNAGLSQNSQRTALSLAAENGSEKICQELLARTDVEPDSLDSAKRSPLMYACKSGALGVVSMLLGTDKVNVDKWDDRGQTVLYFAVLSRNKSIVELLLSQPKIDINHTNTFNMTALMVALEQDDEPMAALLLERGALVELPASQRLSALPLCNTLSKVELLMKTGLSIKQRSTLLSLAAKRSDPEVLSYLLSHGADVKHQDFDGQTALFLAASGEIAELLLSKGADPNHCSQSRETPLISAIKADRQEVIEMLLSKGANVNHSESSNRTALFFAASSKILELPDAGSGAVLRTLKGHTRSVRSVAFSPDGRILASASDDYTVKLWDAWSGAVLQTLEGHTRSVRSVAFSPDGRILVSASDDYTVKLWDACSGVVLQTLEGHTRSISSVAFSPDERILVSASDDYTVKLWDAGSGAVLRTLKGHTRSVRSVAFSPDGRILVSASDDQTVKLWDAWSGAILRTLKGNTRSVRSVAFSPDGRMLVSASDDQTVKLWDAGLCTVLRTLEGHTRSVRSVAFSPDGRMLASASDDQTVKLWDTGLGTVLQTLEGYTRSVRSVAFSPDGTMLASASDDQTVKLLLLKGADPNHSNNIGDTPLIRAVNADRQELVELLLSKGANVNHSVSSGETALHYARSSTVASTLLDAGAYLDYRNHAGRSPLTFAVIRAQADIVHLLIKCGAEVNHGDASGRTPIFFAQSKEIAELLVNSGNAETDHLDNEGISPLLCAIRNLRIEAACFLIQSNASTSGLTKDSVSETLSAITSYDQEGSLVQILLGKGADPDYANEDGMTALSFAAAAGYVKPALRLLNSGATVDFPNCLGMTALTWASLFRQREATQLLLRWNADRSKAKLRNLDPKLRIVEDSYTAHFIFRRPAEYLHEVCDLLPASRELLKKSQHGDRLLYSQSTSEFLEAVAPEKGATVGSRAWKK